MVAALGIKQLARFTRDQFERMIELGILDEDERIELLDGVLVARSPQKDPHALTVVRVKRALAVLEGTHAEIVLQMPIKAGPRSRPEPDLALWPVEAKSVPERCPLIVEVSDSSLRKDRLVKAPIYAQTGTPEYWIVDLKGEAVEVFTKPGHDGYERTARLHRGDTIRLVAVPEVEIAVSDLLPPT